MCLFCFQGGITGGTLFVALGWDGSAFVRTLYTWTGGSNAMTVFATNPVPDRGWMASVFYTARVAGPAVMHVGQFPLRCSRSCNEPFCEHNPRALSHRLLLLRLCLLLCARRRL